ncbi:MAG: methyltransferase domain-containing protein [Chlorobi bacterium]|nr:methyltransferase domain-containing protein [Chlorobiota bacterium]
MKKLYPDSKVELTPLISRNYDKIMNVGSFGLYKGFIKAAIKLMHIKPGDKILDLGCGTGRNSCIMHKYLGDNGTIVGIDNSEAMQNQFMKNCFEFQNVIFQKQRIDQPFTMNEKYDIVFISFVIHGFPHEIRNIIIENAKNNLKQGGVFFILDFAEFNMAEMPPFYRFIFKTIECKYAFDFIEKDWREILRQHNFDHFEEYFFMKNYVRLLKAVKQ